MCFDSPNADMAAVAADPVVRFWWTHCEPCQEPFVPGARHAPCSNVEAHVVTARFARVQATLGGASALTEWTRRPQVSWPVVGAAAAGQPLRGVGDRLEHQPGPESIIHAVPPTRADHQQGRAAARAQSAGWLDVLHADAPRLGTMIARRRFRTRAYETATTRARFTPLITTCSRGRLGWPCPSFAEAGAKLKRQHHTLFLLLCAVTCQAV